MILSGVRTLDLVLLEPTFVGNHLPPRFLLKLGPQVIQPRKYQFLQLLQLESILTRTVEAVPSWFHPGSILVPPRFSKVPSKPVSNTTCAIKLSVQHVSLYSRSNHGRRDSGQRQRLFSRVLLASANCGRHLAASYGSPRCWQRSRIRQENIRSRRCSCYYWLFNNVVWAMQGNCAKVWWAKWCLPRFGLHQGA